MSEFFLLVEPAAAVPAERVDQLTAGLADDLRAVRGLRVAYAQSPTTIHGKSPEAWALGMLVVGGLFSPATMRTIAVVAVAYADRIKARSIRLRRGDRELVITGTTKVDEALVTQLAALLADSANPADPADPADSANPAGPAGSAPDGGAVTGRADRSALPEPSGGATAGS